MRRSLHRPSQLVFDGQRFAKEGHHHLVVAADHNRSKEHLHFGSSAIHLGHQTGGPNSKMLCLLSLLAELIDFDIPHFKVFPTKFIELPEESDQSLFRLNIFTGNFGTDERLDFNRSLRIKPVKNFSRRRRQAE